MRSPETKGEGDLSLERPLSLLHTSSTLSGPAVSFPSEFPSGVHVFLFWNRGYLVHNKSCQRAVAPPRRESDGGKQEKKNGNAFARSKRGITEDGLNTVAYCRRRRGGCSSCRQRCVPT